MPLADRLRWAVGLALALYVNLTQRYRALNAYSKVAVWAYVGLHIVTIAVVFVVTPARLFASESHPPEDSAWIEVAARRDEADARPSPRILGRHSEGDELRVVAAVLADSCECTEEYAGSREDG